MNEREALWELIGAINWIGESWESKELAAAVRHAVKLSEAVAESYPLSEDCQ